METASYKRIALIVAVAVSSTLVWAAAKPWLESPVAFSGYMVLVWPAVALVFASALTGLAWMLLVRPIERIAATLASWASFIFFWKPDIWYVSVLPLFAFLWYESSRRVRNDLEDRHKVRVSTTLGTGMTPLLLGIFLMISLGFYLLPAYHTVTPGAVSVGVQGWLEGAYSQPLVEQQLSQLPPSMQAQVKRDLAKSVDDWVLRILGPLGPFVPPLLAFALFLVLWSVLFIFRELAIWFGVLLFKLLKAVGFIKVGEKDVKAEVITL